MHKLRLLEVHNVWTPQVPEYLPSELRWLTWDKFPVESLPPRFEADNLVGLELYCSSIERPWRGKKKKQQEDSTRSLVLLSVSDRFTNSNNLSNVSFTNCLQLLNKAASGESKNIASTLWQHMIQEEIFQSGSASILQGLQFHLSFLQIGLIIISRDLGFV
ncbi:hypothetical protein LguiA_029674 [Lonicera macranthoides]